MFLNLETPQSLILHKYVLIFYASYKLFLIILGKKSLGEYIPWMYLFWSWKCEENIQFDSQRDYIHSWEAER